MKAQSLVTLKIDGRILMAKPGAYVLQVAREAGIDIPTLCDHPDLEAVGACRLCMVEVTHRDWNGWHGLMTACLYPVSEGIEVSTRSPAVMEARQGILSLLAARCPTSERIQKLAKKYEASTDSLAIDNSGDKCIVCGLCTRVCETYATNAITTYSRGGQKKIGPFDEKPPEECVGCGGCSIVCPTENIPTARDGAVYKIWRRNFETPVCTVETTRCMGCGSCEEACPFSVARLQLFANGKRTAKIPIEHCQGCGACVAACPSGAIDQKQYSWDSLAGQGRK